MSKRHDITDLSPLQRAALALEKMQVRLDAAERARSEPVAIIGLGCRFPGGVRDAASYWRLLSEGVHAVAEVPASRWCLADYYDPERGVPGKMYGRHGGFLDDIDRFDPGFFGISPREAASMDPQQRVLLEVAWEALENAGQAPSRLAGSQTGVFIGVMTGDYLARLLKIGDATRFDGHSATGSGFSFIPGRLSYLLGLEGPSMPVDTACSSSLVAVHLACQSLRSGESRLALAGGVNLILSPEISLSLCSMQAIAADGRCKTFDAAADGYVRSEGCGVLVLKRLSDAVADGDNILALVRGSAMNHDGASGGLIVPSGPAQQAVIRRALANGNVDPAHVSYVEAHGTGTPLGDPIELGALGAVLGKGRDRDSPFTVGSVKTNFGHLEAAAGVAGIIKTVLALQHRELPPHLHFEKGNPHIDWERIPAVVPTRLSPWLPQGGRRIAGVSSFGISGINAHVVLEEAPAPPARPAADTGRPYLLALSAKSPDALGALARDYRAFLEDGGEATVEDVSYTSTAGRAHHEHRLSLVGRTRQEWVGQLDAFLVNETRPGMSSGRRMPGAAARVVFVFPGQGSQWHGMGRQLYAEEPVFRDAIERCEQAMLSHVDWSLRDVLLSPGSEARWGDVDVIQPALFAMEIGLAALFRSMGVEPDAVVGHSMGEVAAAHVAGALGLEDAAMIICRRSKLLRRVSGKGAMALVELSMEQAGAAIRGLEERLSIAVSNSASSTVLSGEPAALAEVLERLQRSGVFCRHVKVDVASHSPQMDPLREELTALLDGVRPKVCSVPLYSTVTGAPVDGRDLVAGYWARNLREPVLFSTALDRLVRDGHALFLEQSPHPILVPAIEQALGPGGAAIASLRRGEDERAALLSAVGALSASGHGMDWHRFRPAAARIVGLPTYTFQRRRYWIEEESAGGVTPAPRAAAASGRPELDPGEPAAARPLATEREALLAAPGEERGARVLAYLKAQVARTLRMPPAELDAERALSQLGLDSIMAMELRRRVELDLGLTLSAAQILKGASTAELATALGEQLAGVLASAPSRPSLTDVREGVGEAEQGSYPLSVGQRSLWLIHQLSPDNPAYNIMYAGTVAALDVAALERAFQALLDRHAALRTTCSAEDGEPRQRGHARMTIPFEITDASAWDRAELDERLAREGDRPFDLTQGPMIRVHVFRRAPGDDVLSFTLHHVAVDLWSFDLLVADLRALYRAERGGGPAPLPPAGVTYADFVRWQSDLLAGPEGERQWRYWQGELSGELPILDLPTDRPRPPVQTYRGAAHFFRLSEPLSGRLKQLAQAEGTTLFTVLLTAFQILLHRYTGQDDMLIGSPLSGRSKTSFEDLTGCFVNTVALRADLSGDPPLSALLGRVRETVLDAMENQDLPFPVLVERLRPPRDPSRSPLFQVMFAWEQSRLPEAGLDALDLRVVETDDNASGQRGAPFDLTLMMSDSGASVPGALRFNADLFDRDTVERMVAHLETLLESVVAAPGERISRLRVVSAAERQKLLVAWNDTGAPIPTARGIHELVDAQAARTPDACSLADASERITYGELARRSNQLARHLRTRGVERGVLVAMAPARSAAMVVGILGVLKAGGAYVPLDPAYPRERIAFMLEDTRAPVLLTHERLTGALPASNARVICLDADWPAVAAESDAALDSGVDPRDLAYVIYTSGSTGKPKGVAITHRSATIFLSWACRVFSPEELRGVLASTSICFDLSVFEMFAPLSCGGTVIVADNALELLRLPAGPEVTLVNTVPSAMTELLRQGGVPASVRTVNLAGEPLQAALVQSIYQLDHVDKVYNLYGPTEDTTYSTFTLVPRDVARVTIGRPIANTQAYVLDAHLEPVPIGVPGELYLGGDGLSRGYLHRLDLTAQRFIRSPFSDDPAERIYRTGDRVRYLPNGELDYLGRTDHQVKVRGYRIELGEIEAKLLGHAAVREVVVVVREDSPGDRRIVAYLAADATAELSASALQAHARQSLPDFMVPNAFVILPALPLTPNGKIDRRALPVPDASRPELEVEYVAPQPGLEETIAGVWRDVLGRTRVGVLDSFFALGGHSLLVVQAHRKLASKIDKPIALVDLFQHPTIASLARHLGGQDDGDSAIRKAQDRARRQREMMRQTRQGPQGGKKPDER